MTTAPPDGSDQRQPMCCHKLKKKHQNLPPFILHVYANDDTPDYPPGMFYPKFSISKKLI